MYELQGKRYHFFLAELSYQHQIYMNKQPNRFSFSNLNSTISAAQCPTGWDFVNGKCYKVIVEYRFRFNFILWIAMILQYFDAPATWNTANTTCTGLCPSGMCHLPRIYSEQQGEDLYNYGKEFHENLSMYKLIWNIQFLNRVSFSFFSINKTVLTKEANG